MNATKPYNAYKKIFLFGLLVQVVAAWFSIGYNHSDEHFQVLEFCNYKLGRSPASELPWEFATHCRTALQPFVVYVICRALQLVGMYNPFYVGFLLRLGMGVCTWLATCRIVALMLPQFVTAKGRQVYVWCSFLLWFVPYIGIRFSAENIAGLLFFMGLTLLPGLLRDIDTKRSLRLMVAGLLFGFALFIRVQMAFAFLGLGLWVVCYAKWPVKNWLLLVFPGLLAIGLSVVVDHWFYGMWVFTPFNYYKVNIIQHAAANFGTEPWWGYFTLFIDYAMPPISCVLLPLFLFGVWKNPRHLFSWICIAFIAGHCMVSHKELRFLVPVIFAFIFLLCKGLDMLLQQYPDKKVYRWAIPTLATINIMMLTIKVLVPAHEAFGYYKFIYNYSQKQPTTLICYTTSPYHIVGLEVNFYKPPGLQIVIVNTPEELSGAKKDATGRSVIFLNPKMDAVPMIAGYKKEKVYCLVPEWLHWFNFNDWIGSCYIWSLYRLD